MREFLFPISDYLHGKEIYPTVRRLLNLLFSISITSYLFEKLYFKYKWLDISNYKGILDFFVKGDFFVPFTLFIVVHFGIWFIAFALFHLINHFNTRNLLKSLYEYDAKQADIRYGIKIIRKGTKPITPVPLTENLLIEAYNEIRADITAEKVAEIEKELNKQKDNIENSFILVFRAFVAIAIYFVSINYFGVLLFLMLTILIFLYFIVSFFTYKLLDVGPAFIRKYHTAVEAFILERQTVSSSDLALENNN